MSIIQLPSYQEFIDSLKEHQYPQHIYHTLLVYFKDDLMLDIGKTNQGVVARKLKMHQAKFNPIAFILKLDIHLGEHALRELEDYIAIEGQADDDYTS
jgi:hypothetical protein